jgi:hypothetical protein
VRGLEVRIASVEGAPGSWSAVLEIEYKGRVYRVEADKLLRRPSKAEASIEGDYLVVKLSDEQGKGFASCHIHLSHLEKGCIDCRCLLKPA